MTYSGFYKDWGFLDNPFSPMPLLGDEVGNKLLIGRESEIRSVIFRLKSGGEAVCLDGPIGVGKTSLANVAAFRVQQDYASNPKKSPLLLPCRRQFQISNNISPEDFKFQVLTEVAQTLIEKSAHFKPRTAFLDSHSINSWLNNPLLRQIEGQILGFGAGTSVSLNESKGFLDSGFYRLITQWLESIFPDRSSGGVVCVIDNLELLETSEAARKTIEALRDTLFTLNGIRWVLCGAHGIIQSVVESPRLVGYLGQPVKVSRLRLQESQHVFNARVSTFKDHTKGFQYLPITADSFHALYMILGQNLRQALATTHAYCLHVAEHGGGVTEEEGKRLRFDNWLKSTAVATRNRVASHVGRKALDLLNSAINKFSGEFTSGDFSAIGFNTIQALRAHVKRLEDVGMVESTTDEADQRRRTITVTGKGWLVNWVTVVS